jgi:hypothetical protein
MKKTITILFLFAFAILNAQEYSYEITSEPGDSTFALDIVTELSEARFSINRTTGLDTAALQQTQYARIQGLYEQIARLHTEITAAERQAAALFRGLNQVGLNQYSAYQISNFDSLYAADVAVWSSSEGVREVCYIQARENNTSVIRRASDNVIDNVIIGGIVPRSPNFIQINLQTGFQIGGVTSVILYARDTRDFRGEDVNGVTYRLRIVR